MHGFLTSDAWRAYAFKIQRHASRSISILSVTRLLYEDTDIALQNIEIGLDMFVIWRNEMLPMFKAGKLINIDAIAGVAFGLSIIQNVQSL